MPKKTKKMKQRAAMRRIMQIPPESVVSVTPITSSSSAPMRLRSDVSSRIATPLTFNYSHIYGDLKRIALFAGFFFIVLIVLSFVIK